MKIDICKECNISPKQNHKNSKYCKPCALKLRKRPRANLTDSQISKLKKLAGTIYYEKLAKQIGASRSSVMRYARDNNINVNTHKYRPEIVEETLRFYEKHGKTKTQEKFPSVKVRSIVERYKDFKPRQTRWKDKEIIELVKMAGLICPRSQARYFNRPRSNEGSIKSVWIKKMKCPPTRINGLPHSVAKNLVTKDIKYIKTYGLSRDKKTVQYIRLALWIDIEKHMKKQVPGYIKKSVSACAHFQRWLHHGEDVKKEIKRIISERQIGLKN